MQPATRLRVAHLRGAPLGTKRPYVRYIYIYTDSEIIVLTRWGSLRLAPTSRIQASDQASEGVFYIGDRCCVLCELVTFARCAFIFALRNIAAETFRTFTAQRTV